MLCSVKLRRTLLVCTAVSFAAVDLVHKSLAHSDFHHARTPLVALSMGAVIAALCILVPRVQSNTAALGAGVACGQGNAVEQTEAHAVRRSGVVAGRPDQA